MACDLVDSARFRPATSLDPGVPEDGLRVRRRPRLRGHRSSRFAVRSPSRPSGSSGPSSPSADKATIYECGERPIGRRLVQLQPALLPGRPGLRDLRGGHRPDLPGGGRVPRLGRGEPRARPGWPSASCFLFIAILVVGLVWVWAHGDLEWVKKLRRTPARRAPDSPPEQRPRSEAGRIPGAGGTRGMAARDTMDAEMGGDDHPLPHQPARHAHQPGPGELALLPALRARLLRHRAHADRRPARRPRSLRRRPARHARARPTS